MTVVLLWNKRTIELHNSRLHLLKCHLYNYTIMYKIISYLTQFKFYYVARPSSPVNSQIEMDVTSRQNSLSFESSANYQSTNGIHVQNVRILQNLPCL